MGIRSHGLTHCGAPRGDLALDGYRRSAGGQHCAAAMEAVEDETDDQVDCGW